MRRRVVRSGQSMASIARATGIPRTTLRRRLSGEGQPILVYAVAAIANHLLTPITPVWIFFLLGARDERRSYPRVPMAVHHEDHLVTTTGLPVLAGPRRPRDSGGLCSSLTNPGWDPRRNSCSARGY